MTCISISSNMSPKDLIVLELEFEEALHQHHHHMSELVEVAVTPNDGS
jgi:hypothetical protein